MTSKTNKEREDCDVLTIILLFYRMFQLLAVQEDATIKPAMISTPLLREMMTIKPK